jgi:hypothetical protein
MAITIAIARHAELVRESLTPPAMMALTVSAPPGDTAGAVVSGLLAMSGRHDSQNGETSFTEHCLNISQGNQSLVAHGRALIHQ